MEGRKKEGREGERKGGRMKQMRERGRKRERKERKRERRTDGRKEGRKEGTVKNSNIFNTRIRFSIIPTAQHTVGHHVISSHMHVEYAVLSAH